VGTGKDKRGRKVQIIALVIAIAICVGFAIYSYVWGRSYFQ
jgi:hypothetical protein